MNKNIIIIIMKIFIIKNSYIAIKIIKISNNYNIVIKKNIIIIIRIIFEIKRNNIKISSAIRIRKNCSNFNSNLNKNNIKNY